jgi:hypothetical protein
MRSGLKEAQAYQTQREGGVRVHAQLTVQESGCVRDL